jgi:CPA2 family monovalent cation:H+ antiporter-2
MVFRRLKLPPILAYLFIGVVAGPHALGLIPRLEDVSAVAWFGVVFLLFTIGLEFSLAKMRTLQSALLSIGSAQVFGTAGIVGLLAWFAGMPAAGALALGAVVAQSSSTIIGKMLTEQNEMDLRHGRLGMGVSILQDVTAIPFVIVIAALGVQGEAEVFWPLAVALLKAVAAFALIVVSGRYVLRPLFREVASARLAELFTLTALMVALAAAWLTDMFGLSFALGAFLGGMMLGETAFRHQIEADIRPFRDVLLGMFMVTMGMQLDLRALASMAHWAVLLAVSVLLIKAVFVAALVRWRGENVTVAVRTGVVLAVGGEFGFALLAIARDGAIVSEDHVQLLLSTVLFSMIFGPILIRHNGAIAMFLLGRKLPLSERETLETVQEAAARLSGHIILCGYGRVGQAIAHALEAGGIPCLAMDLDFARVQEASAAGDRVRFGDSARREILMAAGLDRARLLVVTFDDPGATEKVLHHTRELRPDMPVLVRTRDDAHLDLFQKAGATEVVPETLEASLMLISHALLLLGEPAAAVSGRVRDIRAERYRLLRGFFHGGAAGSANETADADEPRLRAVTVSPDAAALGRNIAGCGLDELDVMVTAVHRGGMRGLRPDPQTHLEAGDVVLLYGRPNELDAAERRLLKGRPD